MLQFFVLDEISDPIVKMNIREEALELVADALVLMINSRKETEIRVITDNGLKVTSCHRFLNQQVTKNILLEIVDILRLDNENYAA